MFLFVLNLCVRSMNIRFLLPLTLFLLAAQDSPPIAITTPRAGDVLRGEISIIGSTDVPDFASAQLDFKYASDSAGTWFFLQSLPQPARDTPLYLWDTASLTDGEYILRLRVILADGNTQEVTVPITVQNDAPIPTPTPAPTITPEFSIDIQISTPFLLAASPTPTEVPRPTPSPLPANPAALTQNEITSSLRRGAMVIAGLFVFAGILLRFRRT
jgi:hypothetical protein